MLVQLFPAIQHEMGEAHSGIRPTLTEAMQAHFSLKEYIVQLLSTKKRTKSQKLNKSLNFKNSSFKAV